MNNRGLITSRTNICHCNFFAHSKFGEFFKSHVKTQKAKSPTLSLRAVDVKGCSELEQRWSSCQVAMSYVLLSHGFYQ